MHNSKFRWGLDLIMALCLLLIMVPNMLGHSVHEWAGLIIAAVIVFHIIINWKSIKTITLNFFHHLSFRTRFVYVLNLLIFIAFITVIVSGMYIAESINFSWLGINREGGMSWKLIHTTSAYLTFLLAGLHGGINFRRVLNMIKPAKPSLRSPNQVGLSLTRERMTPIFLLICILAGGGYAFISLDYLTKANPVQMIQALQTFDRNSNSVPQGLAGLRPDQTPSSSGTNQGPQEQRGFQGPPTQSRGEKHSGSSLNLLLFTGVFVSTATVAFLFDQILRKTRHPVKA